MSIQDNAKLLQHLKPCFKGTINWNKYHTKVSTEGQNQYLDFLIDQVFKELIDFLFYCLKMRLIENTNKIFSSQIRNKRLQRYNQWENFF